MATYLPYCDAMIVDQECERLLRYADERLDLIGDATAISPADREAMLAWLDDLAAGIPDEHRKRVEEVYGRRSETYVSTQVGHMSRLITGSG